MAPPEVKSADFGHGAALEFLRLMDAAPAGARGVILNVGSNDGTWSFSWPTKRKHFQKAHKTLDLHLFEPQPIFREQLNRTASQHGANFVPAAAWKAD